MLVNWQNVSNKNNKNSVNINRASWLKQSSNHYNVQTFNFVLKKQVIKAKKISKELF